MKCNLLDLKKIKHPNIINLFCVALLPCGNETQIDMISSDLLPPFGVVLGFV